MKYRWAIVLLVLAVVGCKKETVVTSYTAARNVALELLADDVVQTLTDQGVSMRRFKK